MKYELNQTIFYMRDNKVHNAPVLGRSFVEFVTGTTPGGQGFIGAAGTYYQTCHGVKEEQHCYASREKLLASL